MKRFIKNALVLCLTLILLTLAACPLVYAGGPQISYGSYSSMPISKNENTQIVIKKAMLTFDVSEFPKDSYTDAETALGYTGKVTSQVLLYNPSPSAVTTKVLVPMGNLPDYFSSTEKPFNSVWNDDVKSSNVVVNGSPIEFKIRHTYKRDAELIYDEFVEDSFFSPELPVTKYTFKASGLADDAYDATASFSINDATYNGLIYMPSGLQFSRNDSDAYQERIENGDVFSVYSIGQPLNTAPVFEVYESITSNKKINGTVTPLSTKTMTFKELALTEWTEYSGVLENDWYNAFVSMLRAYYTHGGLDISTSLHRWIEYGITIGSGESITTTVTAPIYPNIDNDYAPDVYEYEYLLTGAKSWASVESIEININTPYYLTDSEIDGFQKTAMGYSLTLDELPQTELSFKLSTSAEPEQDSAWEITLVILGVAFGILLATGLIIFAIVVIIIYIANKLSNLQKK